MVSDAFGTSSINRIHPVSALLSETEEASSTVDCVPFMNLGRQHRALRAELLAAFFRVLDNDAFILGEEVAAFEEEWNAFCGSRYCVGVSSGTAALRLGLEAAGIGRGSEVVVPAHSFYASASAVVEAGAIPVFCDVDDATGLIDPAAAADAVTPRTAAIMGVHLYGQICDMESLRAISDRNGLLLIEDAAQAQGATRGLARAGSIGDIAGFSFYPSKNLGALGDGGAITTSRRDIAERAIMIRNLGQRAKGEHVVIGGNNRLDGLQAAFLRVKLPHLEEWNARRRDIARAYRAALPPELRCLGEDELGLPNYHLFPVRARERAEVASALSRWKVGTGIHYSPALHQHPAFSHETQQTYPCAEDWASTELSLPMFPELADRELELVVEACNATARRGVRRHHHERRS